MTWSIKGRAIEHCNCDSFCPCFSSNFVQPGDYERCRGFIAIHVDEGSGDAAGLDGMTAALVIDAPPAMAEGNWTVGVVVDERADDDQATLLAGMVTGESGGPMAAFGPLIGTNLGYQRAAMEFVSKDGAHRLTASGLIDAEFADMIHEGMDQPVQLVGAGVPFGPPVTISPPTSSRITAFELDIDNSGRHGTTSKIEWAA